MFMFMCIVYVYIKTKKKPIVESFVMSSLEKRALRKVVKIIEDEVAQRVENVTNKITDIENRLRNFETNVLIDGQNKLTIDLTDEKWNVNNWGSFINKFKTEL